MNVILKSRGMQGIIKTSSKDGQGTQIIPSQGIKDEINDKLKNGYGVLDNQKQFLVVNADIEYIKTIMNSEELGIYKEFQNNAMVISNGLGIPPELYKINAQGSTFSNQSQYVKSLYQDRVIPMVNNDDKIFTDKLRLNEYGLELKTSFDHIPALQESFKEEASALNMNVRSAELAYNNNIIKFNKYLEIIGEDSIGSEGDVYKFERDLITTPKIENNNQDGTEE